MTDSLIESRIVEIVSRKKVQKPSLLEQIEIGLKEVNCLKNNNVKRKSLSEPTLNQKKGVHLTANIYKIWVSNKDNQRGKSGDFRVITYLIEETENSIEINLLTIYDKSEEEIISKSALLKIVKQYF